MKFEYDKKRLIDDLNYESESKRVQELRKAAIEVDRAYVINKNVQKLKMKLIYGAEKDNKHDFD